MNFPEQIPVWSWRDAIRKARVPPLTKLVCYSIGNYLSDVGKGCFPSIRTLMRDTGLSNTTMATHIQTAVDAGLLVVERPRRGEGQRFAGSIYLPRFPDACVLAREPAVMQPAHNDDEAPEIEPEASSPPDEGGSRGESSPPGEGGSLGPLHRVKESVLHRVKEVHSELSNRELSTPPLPPERPEPEQGGGEDFGVGWASGWTPEAQAAASRLSAAQGTVHVIEAFLTPELRGQLNPPMTVDAAAFVLGLRRLAAFDAETLAKVADRMLAERKRDLPAVSEIERLAKALAPRRTPPANRPQHRLTPNDVQWPDWIVHLESTDPGMAAAARTSGLIVASSKWPGGSVEIIEPRLKTAA